MGYGLPLSAHARVETLGLATGSGVQATSGAAGVYGALVTIGTTGFGYDGFVLQIQGSSQRTWRIALTASAGGADLPLVTDAFCVLSGGSSIGGVALDFPIRVPAGAVLKVQVAANSASSGVFFSLVGYRGNAKLARGYAQAIGLTDYAAGGVVPANTITLSGTTQTGWVELAAATSAAVSALALCFNGCGSTFGGAVRVAVELGRGPAASEIGTGIVVASNNNGSNNFNLPLLLPYFIPAGTRLSMRGRASSASSAACALAAWGFLR